MKKINITTYKVTVRTGNGETRAIDYGIKDSLVELLFQPSLKLNAVNLLKQQKLADKVMTAENELLLEEEEYTRVKAALDSVEGLSRNDVVFVQRILEAETVEVEVKD